MGTITLSTQQTDYWFAGVLTITTAAVVTVETLVSSGSDNDEAG